MKTADRLHVITILLSLGAIGVSLFSLQQSCKAQRVSKATSRAMLIFKSAQVRELSISVTPETIDIPQKQSMKFFLDFQVQNVGKAVAHNPSLQYALELAGVARKGTIKFMDDPPGTPVAAEASVEISPYDLHREIEKNYDPMTFTVHYKLSYDDEATGTHFDEKESCLETLVGRSRSGIQDTEYGKSLLQPCLPAN